jgi:hypothetical protein
MGINLGSNFTMNAALPLDDRGTAADLTERNAIASGRRYVGMVVYVESEETNFQLIGGITNSDWAEFSGSGGGAGSTGGTETLTNNAVNTLVNIGEYLVDFSGIIVDYYLYRRTDSGNKRMSGRVFLESVEDGATNPDKWAITELLRSEYGGASGVTFSLDDVDTEKSVLVATLDDFTGAGHECKFYYTLTKFSVSGDKYTLANNAVTSMSGIGEYLSDSRCVIIDYYIYRRTDSNFKTMSGKIFLEGVTDGATNPDKWSLFEAERSENLGASGVTFSLDDIDTEKSILVATLDNMSGTNYACSIYYNKKVFPL